MTRKQFDFLNGVYSEEITKRGDPHTWSVNMKRIREQIDKNMERLLWIAEFMPEILHDAEYEIQNFENMERRRLKTFMKVIKFMYPEKDVELVRLREELAEKY